jgi:hypothetical protein
MSLGASLAASLLATLSRPAWWALGLAAFLVRGGFAAILLPIVTLPTVAGLANAFAPTLVGFVFGGPSVAFLVTAGAIVAVVLAWFVAAGLVGAAVDLALTREVARDDELEDVDPPASGGPGRAFVVRVIAHLPTAVALGLGAVRLVEASYDELIHPGDPAIAVPLRVALRIPEVILALVGTWVAGEAVGGLAVRHLAWGASVPRAVAAAVRSVIRPAALATLVVTNGVLALVVLGSATAAGITWDHLRIVLVDGGPGNDVRLALIVFAVTWAAGAWLIALAVAWRAAAWTFEVARHRPPRTIESTAA